MKTGRLLKFHRPGGEVQAYLYREGSQYRASVYVTTAEGTRRQAVHDVAGASEAVVEENVRSWVESHFPRSR
jgi:hypothetical protein